MKPTDIQIGSVYDLKVGRNTTPVRIMQAAPAGGWEAIGLTTSKPVAIKSADRLVGLHNPKKTPTSAQGAKSSTKPAKAATQAKSANRPTVGQRRPRSNGPRPWIRRSGSCLRPKGR